MRKGRSSSFAETDECTHDLYGVISVIIRSPNAALSAGVGPLDWGCEGDAGPGAGAFFTTCPPGRELSSLSSPESSSSDNSWMIAPRIPVFGSGREGRGKSVSSSNSSIISGRLDMFVDD